MPCDDRAITEQRTAQAVVANDLKEGERYAAKLQLAQLKAAKHAAANPPPAPRATAFDASPAAAAAHHREELQARLAERAEVVFMRPCILPQRFSTQNKHWGGEGGQWSEDTARG